jgi:uncharacterized SAM-binding protein YcdF (DUF218 family)
MDESMPMVEQPTGSAGTTGVSASGRGVRRRGSLLRRLGRALAVMIAAFALLLAGGFGWFVWRLPAGETALDHDADGIVVLTGGASRIFDAMELLAAGRGRRLLISGTDHPSVTSGEISRLDPRYGQIISCCVDFDRSQNTLGNAIETRHWAQARGFRSLIVVTSSYHMPRAIAEISNQLPEIALVPFPVIAERTQAEPSWTHGPSAKLMLSEYLKYLAAQLRIHFISSPEAEAEGPPRQLEQKHAVRGD